MDLAKLKRKSHSKAQDGKPLSRITQRSDSTDGIACIAMLSRLSFKEVLDVGKELCGDNFCEEGHRASIQDLRIIFEAVGWKLGRKTKATNWKKVPAQSLVAIQFKEGNNTWHWVVTDEDPEGPFFLNPHPSVNRDKNRDLSKKLLYWYHRVEQSFPDKPQWEIDLHNEYKETLEWVRNLTPETPASADDSENWNQYLDFWEKYLLKNLESTVRTQSQARKLVRRGWALLDEESRTIECCLELEKEESRHAIPTVLENTGEGWHQPVPVLMTLRFLPEFVSINGGLRKLHPSEEFRSLIERTIAEHSEKPWTAETHHARMLAQAASVLDNTMYIPMGSGRDMRWLHEARKSMSFWRILNAAISFGEKRQLYEIYQDGQVEKSVRNFILSPLGKKGGPWEPVIEHAIGELEAKNKPTSPAKVLKHLGGVKNPVSDDQPCIFEKEAFKELPPVSWITLQSKVKRIRRKRS